MTDLSPTDLAPGVLGATDDRVSVLRWFLGYAAALAAVSALLALLVHDQPWTWSDWIHSTGATLHSTGESVKLIFFGTYLSLCTTFLPLPTGWIVAAVATREAAVGSNAWTTTLLVATVGAIGSTIANLNDYHLFTWMLRSHRVAKIRHTKLYEKSAMWFSRSPFFLLVVFNIVPIPVDVVRILATTYRYPRGPFAAANFIGRFLRYAVIAFVTYWWNLGYVAVLALLALAVVLAAVKAIPYLYRKISGRSEVHA